MIFVTGGAGYIGSHTVIQLIQEGHDVVVFDNLSSGTVENLERIQKITGQAVLFERGDLRDLKCLTAAFSKYPVRTVMHFAGLKIAEESVFQPINYYDHNVLGSINLIKVMQLQQVERLVFSSSAAVYGEPQELPIPESAVCGQTATPYGSTKLIIEQALREWCVARPQLSVSALRYFNPIGAHPSALIGERPSQTTTNLVPRLLRVTNNEEAKLHIYGGDYATPDGTGVRDYIHIMDVANGHLAALNSLASNPGFNAINLGTGRGYSVLEVLTEFEQISGKVVPYTIRPRRSNDICSSYADPSLAKMLLNWEAEFDLRTMLADAWRWSKKLSQ